MSTLEQNRQQVGQELIDALIDAVTPAPVIEDSRSETSDAVKKVAHSGFTGWGGGGTKKVTGHGWGE